jgi:hypothetical protein
LVNTSSAVSCIFSRRSLILSANSPTKSLGPAASNPWDGERDEREGERERRATSGTSSSLPELSPCFPFCSGLSPSFLRDLAKRRSSRSAFFLLESSMSQQLDQKKCKLVNW